MASCNRVMANRIRRKFPLPNALHGASRPAAGSGATSARPPGTIRTSGGQASMIAAAQSSMAARDRKSVVKGQGVSVLVELGGRRTIKKKNINIPKYNKYV